MKNFVQPGDSMTLTAPGGGVTSGSVYKIGQLLVVATHDADAADAFVGKTTGVFSDMPKATGQSWTEGAALYWDNGAGKFTTTASGNLLAGCAAEAAGSSDTTGTVRLNGTVKANES